MHLDQRIEETQRAWGAGYLLGMNASGEGQNGGVILNVECRIGINCVWRNTFFSISHSRLVLSVSFQAILSVGTLHRMQDR
jgi:hypothetical protein